MDIPPCGAGVWGGSGTRRDKTRNLCTIYIAHRHGHQGIEDLVSSGWDEGGEGEENVRHL